SLRFCHRLDDEALLRRTEETLRVRLNEWNDLVEPSKLDRDVPDRPRKDLAPIEVPETFTHRASPMIRVRGDLAPRTPYVVALPSLVARRDRVKGHALLSYASRHAWAKVLESIFPLISLVSLYLHCTLRALSDQVRPEDSSFEPSRVALYWTKQR